MSRDVQHALHVERVEQPRRWGTVPLPSAPTQPPPQSPPQPPPPPSSASASTATQPAIHTRRHAATLPVAARTRYREPQRPRLSHSTKLGLGINERTGRLQWCPGFKCCKFLIVLPVVLLPVTLVLVLLMRLDGVLLMVSRSQPRERFETNEQPLILLPHAATEDGDIVAAAAAAADYADVQQQAPAAAIWSSEASSQNDYDATVTNGGGSDPDDNDENGGSNIEEDLLGEQLILPYEMRQLLLQQQEALLAKRQRQQKHQRELQEEERIKRCIVSIKFGLSETLDVEEHELMKDARTSFLPQEPIMAIPRDCLKPLDFADDNNDQDLTDAAPNSEERVDYLKRRLRRRNAADTSTSSNSEATLPESTASQTGQPGDVATDSGDSADNTESIDIESLDAEEPEGTKKRSASITEDDDRLIEVVSNLQSFWNEEGTTMSIRQTQSNTMRSYMDVHVNPCQDFYKFACGNWERMHPIPRDKAGFDTFEMLRENLDAVLKELLESKDLDNTKRKVAPLRSNNFDEDDDGSNGNSNADIVKSPVAAGAATAAAVQAVKKTELEEKIRLRRHIISRRQVLGRILTRYKRQTSSTKRKRLSSLINADGVDSSTSGITTTITTTITGGSRQPNNNNNFQFVIKAEEPSAQQKAKYLYQSCTNTHLLQRRGIQPLLRLIDQLGGWPVLNANWNAHHFDWLNLTAQLRRYNNDILIVQWVGPDIKNSDENVIQFDQTSLGLPTREYFLQLMNAKYLQAYQRFASEVMHKLGAPISQAHKTANELIGFETQLAQITSPAEDRLNVTKLYKRMTLRQLHEAIPEIDWMRYLKILQQREVRDNEEVVIYAMDYMQDLVQLLSETEPRVVANYLLWRFVRHRINNVDERFEDVKQNFYHSLFGREESPQRWKVCIAQVNTNMGMALGSMFVSKYFDENSKRDTLKMTHELQQAFREILQTTDWLDSNTKHLAELKVNAMSLKIGYPDFILNSAELNEKYAGIDIDPDRYFENTLNVLLHTARIEQNKLHEPVNKTAWQTAPAIVNAYYSRNKNQIMFPAGILQPPFYHRNFPRSLNFGGIGVVIGHELTHGFDDKGRLFDRNGSIHKWWTDTSIKGFDERARCIIAQYSNYTVGEVGITLNGESTQGENIADNGGIRQAFHAYKAWLHNNPEAARNERLPGLNMTGEQLFFLNFGQVWCGAMRPEAVRNKLNTAIHSPGRFRVIGTLSNSFDFAREFQCPVGSPMNPVHKCSVW